MTTPDTPAIPLPCGHTIAETDLLRLAGQITGRRRAGRPGGRNGGRPRVAERCPCGEMTQARAKARGHACAPPDAEKPR